MSILLLEHLLVAANLCLWQLAPCFVVYKQAAVVHACASAECVILLARQLIGWIKVCTISSVDCASLCAQYVPYVVEIDSTVKIAGGINTPLIIRVTDDSGRTQKQLCKCNDDLRQVSMACRPVLCACCAVFAGRC